MIGSSMQPMTKTDIVVAFIAMFLIQFMFALDGIIQDLSMGSELAPVLILVVKQASASLVTTLVFYGYNKISKKPLEG